MGGGNPQPSTSGGKSTLTITELLQLEKRMSSMCWLVSCKDGCFTLAPGAQGISHDAPCQDHTSSAQNHLSVHRYGPTKHRLCKFVENVGGCNSQCAQAVGEGKARRKGRACVCGGAASRTHGASHSRFSSGAAGTRALLHFE